MYNLPAVGISFGSTYSSVGVFRNGRFCITRDEEGNDRIPNYVAFVGTECFVGGRAKACTTLNPSQVVYSIQRLLGRTYDDPYVQANLRLWPFKVVNYCGRPRIRILRNGKVRSYYAEEIAAMVLSKLKEMVETYYPGEKILDVVISVPAGFNRFQRQATNEACELAGLNVIRMLTDSTAAGLAFGIDATISTKSTAKYVQNVLIFDLGGGTCSVTIVSIDDNIFKVLSTTGDRDLGGEDVDNRLVRHFIEKFRQTHKLDLRCSVSAMQRLRTACEDAKRMLSRYPKDVVELNSLHQGMDLHATISREQLEYQCSDLFGRALALVRKALDDVRPMRKEDIDEFILIGGSTHIPQMQKLLTEYFGGRMLNRSMDPNEATVYGAAVQAAVLSGSKDVVLQNVLLLDAVPSTLGIETADGTLLGVLKRNRTLPTKDTIFCTTMDHEQPAVTIKVYEGEHALAKTNLLVRRFEHFGIAPAPPGVPRIAVTFDIDADNKLHISVEDKSSDLDSLPSDQPVYVLAYSQ